MDRFEKNKSSPLKLNGFPFPSLSIKQLSILNVIIKTTHKITMIFHCIESHITNWTICILPGLAVTKLAVFYLL